MKEFTDIRSKYDLPAIVEALLFVAVVPISISQLASILDETPKTIDSALSTLENSYVQRRGLRVQRKGKKISLVTAPDLSKLIEDFMGIETSTSLSRASLETLAIIAFRQPITRPMIEDVRGVNSDGVVRNLLSKGLIEEVGRVESVGRAILYSTTSDFLSHFGLNSLKDLPPFDIPDELPEEDTRILKD